MTGLWKGWNPNTQEYEPLAYAVPKANAAMGARVYTNTSETQSASDMIVNFQVVDYDTHGFWQSATKAMVIPQGAPTGPYRVYGGVAHAANSTGTRALRWLLNGASVIGTNRVEAPPNSTNVQPMIAEDTFWLKPGDYVQLYSYSTVSLSLNGSVSDWDHGVFTINYEGGIKGEKGDIGNLPHNIGAEVENATVTCTTGAWKTLPLTTTIRDSDGMVDLINDVFTLPEDGWYLGHLTGYFNASTAGVQRSAQISLDGTFIAQDTKNNSDFTGGFRHGISAPFWGTQGQDVSFEVLQDTGGDLTYLDATMRVTLLGGPQGEPGYIGSDGPRGSTWVVQSAAPTLDLLTGDKWTDSDDGQVYEWDGDSWEDTGYNQTGDTGADGTATAWPIDSIFMSVSHSTPAAVNAAIGYGTWVALGEGRVLVGASSTDNDFDAGDTGGSKTNSHEHDYNTTIAHTHTVTQTDHTHGIGQNDHTHVETTWSAAGATNRVHKSSYTGQQNSNNSTAGASDSSAWSGGASTNVANANSTGSAEGATYGNSDTNNLQPYLAVYMWKRTA